MFKMIPLPIRILSLILGLVVSFLYGVHVGTMKSKVTISDFTATKTEQQAKIQKEVSEKNIQIVTKYVDRWHTIKEIESVNKEYAKNIVPNQHDLSVGWVSTHNASASSTKVDSTSAANPTPSGVTDNQALETIIDNYSKYHQCSTQLNSVLDVIEAYNNTIDKVNKETEK